MVSEGKIRELNPLNMAIGGRSSEEVADEGPKPRSDQVEDSERENGESGVMNRTGERVEA